MLFNLVLTSIQNKVFSKKLLLGEWYHVIPVVMIKAGAYSPNVEGGAREEDGPLFFSADTLQKSLNAWDGRPILKNHPDGFSSSNSPEVYDKQWVGYIFNVRFVNSNAALVADAWINSKRGEDIIAICSSGEDVDVSIGAYGDIIGKNRDGDEEVNGPNFEIINLVPDHLAILVDSIGACSNVDGCGLGIAAAKKYRYGKTIKITQDGDKMVDNYIGKEQKLIFAILSEARTPKYEGTETISWADVGKTIDDYIDGYYKHSNGSRPEDLSNRVSELPSDVKTWIASKSLLGDSAAEDERDLLFFPVVNPNTDKLNEGALRAVISGRGTQADIPSGAKESAQGKARSLLDKEFGAELVEEQSSVAQDESSSVDINCLESFIETAPCDIKKILSEAISMHQRTRDNLISKVINYNDGFFKKDFLTSLSLENLKKIGDIVGEVESLKNKQSKEKSMESNHKAFDFSLQSAPNDKVLQFVPPAKIEWK